MQDISCIIARVGGIDLDINAAQFQPSQQEPENVLIAN